MSNFTVFPDIRDVADLDQDYVNDMMNIVSAVDFLESQSKAKTG